MAEKTQNNDLYYALAQCRTAEEFEKFMQDLCSPAELKALKERWEIARLLDEKQSSYRKISTITGASTTTIGRVARFLSQEPHKGYRLVLNRLKQKKALSANENEEVRAA